MRFFDFIYGLLWLATEKYDLYNLGGKIKIRFLPFFACPLSGFKYSPIPSKESAISSVVEQYLDMVEVTGSNPVLRTISPFFIRVYVTTYETPTIGSDWFDLHLTFLHYELEIRAQKNGSVYSRRLKCWSS